MLGKRGNDRRFYWVRGREDVTVVLEGTRVELGSPSQARTLLIRLFSTAGAPWCFPRAFSIDAVVWIQISQSSR